MEPTRWRSPPGGLKEEFARVTEVTQLKKKETRPSEQSLMPFGLQN